MTKYESVLYLRSLQLPSSPCKYFEALDFKNKTNLDFYNLFKFYNLVKTDEDYFGIRTEDKRGLGYNYPFYVKGTYDLLRNIIIQDKDNNLYYLIYKYISTSKLKLQGNSYLNYDRTLISYVNSKDKVSNRKAFEDPKCQKNIYKITTNWGDKTNLILSATRLYLIRASLIDTNIVGQRIEWSYFNDLKHIFWQCNTDDLY